MNLKTLKLRNGDYDLLISALVLLLVQIDRFPDADDVEEHKAEIEGARREIKSLFDHVVSQGIRASKAKAKKQKAKKQKAKKVKR